MQRALTALHEFAEAQYAQLGDSGLMTLDSELRIQIEQPIWQWQSAELRPVPDARTATGAVILDADIGLCLLVQFFDPRTNLRGQIARALSIRSDLIPSRKTDAAEVDPQGEWSVALLWLAEEESFSSWVDQIAVLREETAYFEELPVDILLNRANDWATACKTHGLPRLLLQTRLSLRRPRFEDSTRWASADPQIVERILKLTEALEPELRLQGQQLVDHMTLLLERPGSEALKQRVKTPKALHRISISQFRNVERMNLEFREADGLVEANIIQGPNGTGKSSIAEALAIAIGNTSKRYLEYLSDSNEANQNKPRKYLERYLSPIREENTGNPRLGLNSNDLEAIALAQPEEAKEKLVALSGTIFSQSWGESLLHMRADELGAQIAGDYSKIASALLEFMDTRIRESETARATFNRGLGLRANVSRDNTASFRIVSAEIANLLPSHPTVVQWLKQGAQVRTRHQEEFSELLYAWTAWQEASSTREQELVRLRPLGSVRQQLRDWLVNYQAIIGRTKALVDKAGAVIPANSAENLLRQIGLWGHWLRAASSRTTASPSEVQDLKKQVDLLQSTLASIGAAGMDFRAQLTQLEAAEKFIDGHWKTEHPSTCPICSSDVGVLGGIALAISKTRTRTEAQIVEKRNAYAETRQLLSEAVAKLSQLDSSFSALPQDELDQLQLVMQAILGPPFELDHLRSTEAEALAVQAVRFFANSPPVPLRILDAAQIETAAGECARRISSTLTRFAEVSQTPEAWKAIQRQVIEELSEIIKEHLPNTIQALWWELARNTMPASWQYPGAVTFSIDAKRSQTEARLTIEGSPHHALAAHILNDAELHNLGLAWFLTRYLTFGRYENSSLILDDPAQQMDQPTFRDFCRLLEALVRLHRGYRLPLTLVMFLHEDGRALDAARATNATLHLLRWHQGTASLVKKMKMRTAPVAPRKPYRLFQAA